MNSLRRLNEEKKGKINEFNGRFNEIQKVVNLRSFCLCLFHKIKTGVHIMIVIGVI